jgi:diguanylate cyclase (GGDEF)-like protein/PAS domain S-box-containing protein
LSCFADTFPWTRMFEESNPGIFREILERLATGVYVVDRSRKIVFWNDGAEKLSGYLRQEVLGRFCRDNLLEHCNAKSRPLCHCACPLAAVMQDGHPREGRMYLKHRDGRRIPVVVRAVAITDDRGATVGAAESFDVQILAPTIGNLPASNAEEIDDLTGLPNPWFVVSYLQQRTKRADTEFRPFTVLRITVSHYSELQARYGATGCAELVRNVAQALRNALKPSDVLGRWGECRFVVVVEMHEEHLLRKVCERLQSAVQGARMHWWGDSIEVTAVIEERTLERSEDRQSVLSWLGPASVRQSQIMHAGVHALHCAAEEDD